MAGRGRPNARQRVACGKLQEQVVAFLDRTGPLASAEEVDKYLSLRSVSYCGEVVPKAEPLTWDRVRRRLQTKEQCATIDAVKLSEGSVK